MPLTMRAGRTPGRQRAILLAATGQIPLAIDSIDDHGVDSPESRADNPAHRRPEALRTTRGSITQPNIWRFAMVSSRLWPLAEGVTKSNAVEQLIC